jgi:hypothetical protein
MKYIVAATVLTLASPLASFAQPVVGVWKPIEDVDVRGPDRGRHTTDVQPGLLIFTRQHYSATYILGYAPRPRLGPNSTVEERLRVFDSFVGTAGTYEWNDSTLTLTASVAKNPAGMDGKGRTVQVRLQADSLWLTIRALDGTEEGTVKWLRIERPWR